MSDEAFLRQAFLNAKKVIEQRERTGVTIHMPWWFAAAVVVALWLHVINLALDVVPRIIDLF